MEVSDATAYYMPGCAKCATLPSDSARCIPSHSISTRVTVLLGLMECDGRRTLSGMLREVGQSPRLSGLSRFLTEAPWCSEAVVASWQRHFRAEMQPLVTAEREQQRHQQPKRRGRPKHPHVPGYVIGDDSTMSKLKGRKMEGLGKRHSTTSHQRIVGHSLVQGRVRTAGSHVSFGSPVVPSGQGVRSRKGAIPRAAIEPMEALIREAGASCWHNNAYLEGRAATAPNACGMLPASATVSSPLGSRGIAGCALLMKRLPKAGAGKSSRTTQLS